MFSLLRDTATGCTSGETDPKGARAHRSQPNLPSHSLTSARILAASSSLRPTPSNLDTPSPRTDAETPIPAREVLAAALAALRLHPSLPLPRAFLRSLLSTSHPPLVAALEPRRASDRPAPDPAAPAPPTAAPDDTALEAELQRLEVGEPERDILRRVLGLCEGGAAGDDELEGAAAGRDVRSL